ncbi:MAG: DUF1810 domain-containing protein [Clostridiales bacterium]|nr:DUF1810 domain-containing protein [Clostridiales bacterium]
MSDLDRFKEAQKTDYPIALAEIRSGRKQSHWIWYIFPQLRSLGRSGMAKYYGIKDLQEAKEYLADEVLRENLLEISRELLNTKTDNARVVMGSPDDLKLRSCMTLFLLADPNESVFQSVLDKFYHGEKDENTLRLLGL